MRESNNNFDKEGPPKPPRDYLENLFINLNVIRA